MTVYEALIIFLSDFQIYENVNLKQGKLARQKHVLYNMLDVDFQWKWGEINIIFFQSIVIIRTLKCK